MTNRYGWVMVAIGALMTCVAVGAMFSLAVFLEPMTRDTGWSRAGIVTGPAPEHYSRNPLRAAMRQS